MYRTLALSFALCAAPLPVLAASHTVLATADNRFEPQDLTIEAGDSVTWINQGGTHNVRADDGSFRCAVGCDGEGGDGSPSNAAWQFTRTFDTIGTIGYDCEFHVSLGMIGSITVTPDSDPPGDLRLAASVAQVGESAGPAEIAVERVGGDDGVVSVTVKTGAGSATAAVDFTPRQVTLSWPDGDDTPRVFQFGIIDDELDELDETVNVTLSDPTGGAGLLEPTTAVVTILDDDDSMASPGVLAFSMDAFDTTEGNAAQVRIRRTGGSEGAVGVRMATADGTAEAGIDYLPLDVVVQWGDGDSTVKTVEVSTLDDAVDEAEETIFLGLGTPTGGAVLGEPVFATVQVGDDDPPSGAGCVPDDSTLCLGENDRFRVRMTWTSPTGAGDGLAVDIGKRDSGLFYFFDEDNLEVLLKVLDACVPDLGERFWVFYAATTTLAFDIEVVDTVTGRVRHYLNELGVAAPTVTDTEAFPCEE